MTTRLWMTYAQTLLRRGAQANVDLARDLALDTIFYAEETGQPAERARVGGRAAAEHGHAGEGLTAGDHGKGAGGVEAGAAAGGGAMAEGARCCLAAMLLYDDAALLGSRFSADASDSPGDTLGPETGACPDDTAAADGGVVALAGEEGGIGHTAGRRCDGDGDLLSFRADGEMGAGGHTQDTGARLWVDAAGADGTDVLRRAATRERIREAETLLMRCRLLTMQNQWARPLPRAGEPGAYLSSLSLVSSDAHAGAARGDKLMTAGTLICSVFFHDDRQPTALALYGGMLWVQGRCSQALGVLAQVRLC